ncbi:hypothetical protein N7468_001605 [Penicillium chermesinum]|uniref:Potassium channel domain-containing protein n=1 Tax=Penicillium chermesinum TaxID=63820 RepID=A0A9W9TX89_9EURO|nr:uncharacterized protein N7468_001605 [Penicillium chermesinum]KAJ5246622.1 hypothetical protein N7468_001605 [Penicillium chermesinum]
MRNGSSDEATKADQASLWRRFKGNFQMRPPEDDEPQSWWIASTAIPLVAAAAGPLANVMSIVALVMPWRSRIISRSTGPAGNWVQEGYDDPHWSTGMNAASLVCGVVGNIFLLLNFTQAVRYIIALPVTIILWFLAPAILCAATASLHIYAPPVGPDDVYSQAYWSAVIAAALYFLLGVLLMINMLGYFLGRYPQHFSLTDDQRTLILQMTALVAWLLIGAAIFQRVLGISFADALYFCDITVLTLGFGDVTAQTATGKGLIWPYAVIGVIMLGLVVSSIHRFAREVHYDNVVRKHIESKRQWTFDRTITSKEGDSAGTTGPAISALARRESQIAYHPHHKHQPIRSAIDTLATGGRPKVIVMREEKDRFDAMRAIQYETMRFRRWNDLVISVIVFGIVWSCGAVVFWLLEHDWSYFDALYFCFVCLLTIGYGDYTPQSNAGRPFFVFWSLVAIPTMTMLISQMSDTVVASFNHGTKKVAEVFILPEAGTYRGFIARIPFLRSALRRHQEKKRVERGFPIGADTPDEAGSGDAERNKDPILSRSRRNSARNHPQRTIEELAQQPNPSPFELAQQLAFAIRRVTEDVCSGQRKRYSYEEWVEFTRLIQFTNPRSASNPSAGPSQSGGDENTIALEEDEYGVLNWDWIGESSPMLAHQSEPEWVLDRLCESLVRYVSTQEQARKERLKAASVDEEMTLAKERDLGIEES